jgi:hypothetical protein
VEHFVGAADCAGCRTVAVVMRPPGPCTMDPTPPLHHDTGPRREGSVICASNRGLRTRAVDALIGCDHTTQRQLLHPWVWFSDCQLVHASEVATGRRRCTNT